MPVSVAKLACSTRGITGIPPGSKGVSVIPSRVGEASYLPLMPCVLHRAVCGLIIIAPAATLAPRAAGELLCFSRGHHPGLKSQTHTDFTDVLPVRSAWASRNCWWGLRSFVSRFGVFSVEVIRLSILCVGGGRAASSTVLACACCIHAEGGKC
jgi:hypothetical protein